MKKHAIDFPMTTTMENLDESIRPCYGAMLKFNDKVLVANFNWKGQYEAATYEFIESPAETGLGEIECRLNLLSIADETFADAGHAMAWALSQAQ